ALEHPEEVTRNDMGAGVGGVDVRQREELEVRAGLRGGDILSEEAGDEVALVDHVALGRAGQHGIAHLPEVGGQHVVLTAVYTLVEDLAERLPGLLDLRRGPFQLALPPLVVDIRTRLTE